MGDSRSRVIALIDDLRAFLGGQFPSSNNRRILAASASSTVSREEELPDTASPGRRSRPSPQLFAIDGRHGVPGLATGHIGLGAGRFGHPLIAVMSGTALGSIPRAFRSMRKYRREFERCDRENIFRNQPMTKVPAMQRRSKSADRAQPSPCGTISFDAKLGLDIDGGDLGHLTDPGLTDLRDTSYRYPDGSSVYSDTVP